MGGGEDRRPKGLPVPNKNNNENNIKNNKKNNNKKNNIFIRIS